MYLAGVTQEAVYEYLLMAVFMLAGRLVTYLKKGINPVAKWDFCPEPQKFWGKPFYCIFFIDIMILIKPQDGVEL